MSRHYVSKKDGNSIIEMLAGLGMNVPAGSKIEVEERKEEEFYLVNGKPLAYRGENFYPSLQALNGFHPEKNWIEVDDGAVPHLTNGANLFAGGIVSLDPKIRPGDLVFVRNRQGIYFSVMKATRTGEDIARDRKGEAAKCIHYPNDRVYLVFREITH